MGRPSKYKDEYAEQAFKLCLLGATDKELADFFDTTEQTINAWKNNHPKFLESLKKGKMAADAKVASKLYHRAIGYEHPEIITATFQGSITDTMEVVKHYPPDTTAGIFWLKNRDPARWRDKQDIEHTGKMALDVDIERMDDNEILGGIEATLQAINDIQKRIGTKGE